ncbi:hypothetical protein Slin14017_G101260 [Septoria linicola]|nr:hypothetical protein Slin14017_G101260 [Septoria linicola]
MSDNDNDPMRPAGDEQCGRSESQDSEEQHARQSLRGGAEARDNSRQHNGDLTVNGPYYYYEAARYTMMQALNSRQEHRQGCQTAETSSRRSPNHGSGSIAGVQELLLALIEEFLLMVLRRVQSLPQQVDIRLCTFKDALDRDFKTDPTLIVDWEACYSPISITFCVAIDDDNQIFELILCDTFGRASGARGVQRIRNQMYRLHDATTEQVVIPDRGRAFARVFTPGRHLRMSMYFYENEMSAEGCPACGQPWPRTGRRWTIW